MTKEDNFVELACEQKTEHAITVEEIANTMDLR